LYATDKVNSLITKGRIEFKLGYDGVDYINKLTFKLEDNDNINRVVWKNQIRDQRSDIQDQNLDQNLKPTPQPSLASLLDQSQDTDYEPSTVNHELFNPRISYGNLHIDWSDFKDTHTVYLMSMVYPQCLPSLIPLNQLDWQYKKQDDTDLIIFYPEGKRGEIEVDPTLSLSTPTNQVQIDVASSYRAVMNTNQTTDYLLIYDRRQNDGSPPLVFEFLGPWIQEGGVDYALRRDSARTTYIISAISTQIKIQVSGKYMNEASAAYLPSESAGVFLSTPRLIFKLMAWIWIT